MDSLPSDAHHPFVDLDVHHDTHTDAEEALEAIRVAIGQSTDFDSDPLHDVSVGVGVEVSDPAGSGTLSTAGGSGSHHTATLGSQHLKPDIGSTSGTHDIPVPTLISATQLQSGVLGGVLEKGLKAIVEMGYSNELLLDRIDSPEYANVVGLVALDIKKQNEIANTLLAQAQTSSNDRKSRR